MKNKFAVMLVAVFVLAMTAMSVPKKANATVSFAQKYHFACAVCHTVFPNLNPFGRAFWRNGFRLPGTNGTPADATQIAEGLSLPNPWPIPLMIEPVIVYQHYTNENVNPQTDGFSIADVALVSSGTFKLYTPIGNSISYYVHMGLGEPGNGNSAYSIGLAQAWGSINGLGSGLGIAPHLFNLKIGQVTTASPYFYRQGPPLDVPGNIVGAGQSLTVGDDAENGVMIHSRNAGFDLYGTPGYHLWYKLTVTNDAGPQYDNQGNATTDGVGTASGGGDSVSNAMEYSYQLKEYAPIPMGQLEFGYFGATVAEPITVAGQGTWTNRVTVNGIDADLANDVYELGATYMVQNDAQPYGNPSLQSTPITLGGNTVGNSNSSNGYSEFEIYGRYLFSQIGNGVMLSADYAQYSWTHKDLQEGFLGNGTGGNGCPDNSNLYQAGTYTANGAACVNEGVKDEFAIDLNYLLAYNARVYVSYLFTNKSQDDTVGAGLDFAF
jgi:hypothetical protein